MRIRYWLPLILLMSLCTAARAVDTNILTVAVLNFEPRDESMRDIGPKVGDLLTAFLSAEPQLITVERTELAKIMGEQELGLSGTVSTETAAKVGHLTGAKVIVTGSAFKVGNETMLVAKIIGTETSRVIGETANGPSSTPITDLAKQLAKKIAGAIEKEGTNLVARVESRDDRIARIVKSLKEGKRPSVSIKIAERHFGAVVIDPAAETELAFILQKAGFTVLDDKSTEKPDIEITGEAFSAFGVRKGNLISCKSRVEVKAQKREGGKILAQDSETSVAVDIAEQTSAKSALQNAADRLAERLLPKLLE